MLGPAQDPLRALWRQSRMSGAHKSDKKQDSGDGQEALDAYLRLLESKGADSEVLALRRRVLSRLNLIMRGQPRTTTIYRSAVDALLSLCLPEDRPGAMTAAREYYYFWIGDVKKVTEMNARSGFTTRHVRLPVLSSFGDLQQRMQQDGYQQFPPSLELYLGQLYELGSDEVVLGERGALLKPLLYLLHDQVHHPDSYRMAVDAMLLHLSDSEAKESFLSIAREFFYYWLSFPDADIRGQFGVQSA